MFKQDDIDNAATRLVDEYELLLRNYQATATDDQLRLFTFFMCHKMAALQVLVTDLLEVEAYGGDDPPPPIMN